MSLLKHIHRCSRCPELVSNRTHIVLGSGSIPAKIVFLGDIPGIVDDTKGVPFSGSAGRHLRMAIHRAGIPAKDYYILNRLKCRPPEDRDPQPEELTNCRPFLVEQLEILQPKLIVALGKYAHAFCLNKPDTSQIRVTKNAGALVEVDFSSPLQALLTFHPTFVLRHGAPGIDRLFRRHIAMAKEITNDM